jgi:hypothetical protein
MPREFNMNVLSDGESHDVHFILDYDDESHEGHFLVYDDASMIQSFDADSDVFPLGNPLLSREDGYYDTPKSNDIGDNMDEMYKNSVKFPISFILTENLECEKIIQQIDGHDTSLIQSQIDSIEELCENYFTRTNREGEPENPCPICYDYIDSPVVTQCCRKVFCYKCIRQTAVTHKDQCPMCRVSPIILDSVAK